MSHDASPAGGPDAPASKPRPLSPHLTVWRWHVTMLGSILHRVSGIGLALGAVLAVVWLASLAAGPEAYARFQALSGSPLGLLVWFGLSLALFYHLASGVRHLVWDTGAGLAPRTASLLSTLSIVVAVGATVLYWTWLLTSGRVSL